MLLHTNKSGDEITIQGLKTTIEHLEAQCYRKDEHIKELQEKISNLSWQLDNTRDNERVDW